MLDRGSRQQEITQWIDSWPCHVQIPERLAATFEKRGAAPTLPDEQRGHARMRCASTSLHAALRCFQSLPALPREDRWYGVYPTDVSKKGCNFLHFEPLY